MNILNNKAISIIEYTLLFVIISGAFVLMKDYIQRGVYSNWGKAGQSFAFGRQYDPQKSVECAFDDESGKWYDHHCYEEAIHRSSCNGNPECERNVITNGTCTKSTCDQLNHGAVL